MPHDLLNGDAWRDLCARMSALGDEILGDDYPAAPRDRAEGFRALMRKLVYAAQFEIEAGDPDFPTLVRLQDPTNQWGGPNPDNVYLRANIDPTASYRVWADVGETEQIIFSLHEGEMHLGELGVFGECSLSDLHTANGKLELAIAPQARPGNCIVADPRARILTIRIYQSDWERGRVPTFHIVREDNEGIPRPPLTPERLAAAFDRAGKWVEASTRFWNRYTAGAAQLPPNSVRPASHTAGGAANIAYGNCVWKLRPDQALLVTCARPDADYWGFTAHTLGWLESGDFAERQTSLNHRQAHVDEDDVVRIAVAERDPGIANWIDSEQRERGMLVYRWVWARSQPVPEARVVPVDEVRDLLPPTHPRLSPAERRSSLARRRESAWARYL